MPVEQSSLQDLCCLLLVDNPLPCLRSGRFRCVASNGSSVAGRLDSAEEQLDCSCSIDGEPGLMRSFAVAAGKDPGRLSSDESDGGVNSPLMLWDESRDNVVGNLHGRETVKSPRLY